MCLTARGGRHSPQTEAALLSADPSLLRSPSWRCMQGPSTGRRHGGSCSASASRALQGFGDQGQKESEQIGNATLRAQAVHGHAPRREGKQRQELHGAAATTRHRYDEQTAHDTRGHRSSILTTKPSSHAFTLQRLRWAEASRCASMWPGTSTVKVLRVKLTPPITDA